MPHNTGKKRITAVVNPAHTSRREVLKHLLGAGVLLCSQSLAARALAYSGMKAPGGSQGGEDFVFAQLSYEGGSWDAGPSPWENLRRSLEAATSVSSRRERAVVSIMDDRLFRYPFLFISGEDRFYPLTEDEVLRLRKYFKSGGMLFADDGAATPHVGFDASFRREIARVFPDDPLRRLPADHTVYKSFYLIRGMGGRKVVSPFLEGVTRRGRTSVIYSPNGLSAAWARDEYGRWLHATQPGGERQRKIAFQLGVNIIMYALCSDYKQDRIHLPFLRRKI